MFLLWRRLFPLTIVLAASSFFLTPSHVQLAAGKPAASPEAGDPGLVDLDGFKEIVTAHRGKGVLATFWATWCQPCHDEYPMIVGLSREYAPQGLDVIGVTLDEDTDLPLVRHFLSVNRPGFPNYREKPGIDSDAFYVGVNPDWHGTMPETNFYARDGHLARYFVGAKQHDAFVQAIRLILATPNSQNRGDLAVTGGK
jgi:thiol-disulfide isomerase/thioredoxin